jgi:hypothetical protein
MNEGISMAWWIEATSFSTEFPARRESGAVEELVF